MYSQSRKEDISEQVLNLHRGTMICHLLRQEGLLLENSHFLLRLASELLRSYRHRS
jgi:hypothetical protein